MPETAYRDALRPTQRAHHHYGEHVHVLADAWSLSLMARLSSPSCVGAAFHDLLRAAYDRLVLAATEQLATTHAQITTRMDAPWEGAILDPTQRVVVVDVARAGMLPAHLTQRRLLDVIEPEHLRVDHIYMQRVSDPDTGAVTGISLSGSKIGGDVDGATVLIPDPMAATGSSLAHVLETYRTTLGTPRRIVALHLICTPEYLRRVADAFPGTEVYTLRVDRGLSAEDVLQTQLGERWAEEVGLNGYSYIVPGAGGLGELINNAFV